MDIIFTLIELRTRTSDPYTPILQGLGFFFMLLGPLIFSVGLALWIISKQLKKANDIGNSQGSFMNYARTPITYVCREKNVPLSKKNDFIRAYGNTRDWKIAVRGGVQPQMQQPVQGQPAAYPQQAAYPGQAQYFQGQGQYPQGQYPQPPVPGQQ